MAIPSASESPDTSAALADRMKALVAADRAGDEQAFEDLFTLLYDDLKAAAQRQLHQEHSQHTLSSTALVHEAYLRFELDRSVRVQDRGHFLAIASRVMRQVLVDHARHRGADKRGGGAHSITLHTNMQVGGDRTLDVLALAEALDRLAEHDPRLARIVECRFFGGLTTEETASALDTSVRTVERDWKRARLYLHHLLDHEDAE